EAESTARPDVAQQFLERPKQADELFVDAAKEDWTGFLSKYRSVLQRKGVTRRCRRVLQIPGVGHGPQPLAHVSLVGARAHRQFGTGARAASGQVLEQAQAISDGRHGRGREADSVAHDLADE